MDEDSELSTYQTLMTEISESTLRGNTTSLTNPVNTSGAMTVIVLACQLLDTSRYGRFGLQRTLGLWRSPSHIHGMGIPSEPNLDLLLVSDDM